MVDPRYTMIEEEEQELDFKDMLATLALGWKWILCCMLAFMIIVGAYGVKKAMSEQKEGSIPTVERKETLKEALSDAEAAEVERTYAQYQIYQNFISDVSQFSSSFQNAGKMKIMKYYVVSSVKNVNSFFTEMAISSEDYEKIYKVAYPEAEDVKAALVEKPSPLQFSYDYNWDNNYFIAENNTSSLSKEATLITAFITAETEEECEAIQQIVESGFDKEAQALKEVDAGIVCRQVDAHYTSTGKEYMEAIERNNVDRLNLVNNALANMKNNFIDKFTDGQKSYFDYLKEEALLPEEAEGDQPGADVASGISYKTILKYGLVGAVAGCFLACCWLLFKYVLDGSIKTDEEILYYGIPVLNTFYYEKNKGLFQKVARRIRGLSPSAGEVQEHMLAEDISIQMEKCGSKSLYFLMTSNAEEDKTLAEKLQRKLQEEGLDVSGGDPLASSDELKKLSEADRVLIFTHIKDSKRDSISRVRDICNRYDREITGAIAIEVC